MFCLLVFLPKMSVSDRQTATSLGSGEFGPPFDGVTRCRRPRPSACAARRAAWPSPPASAPPRTCTAPSGTAGRRVGVARVGGLAPLPPSNLL